jgi:hypothetical protein
VAEAGVRGGEPGVRPVSVEAAPSVILAIESREDAVDLAFAGG